MMKYISTRDKTQKLTAAQAIARGLARDGGLLMPEVFPHLPSRALESLKDMSYQQRAVYVMKMFLEDFSVPELTTFAATAYGGDKFSHKRVAPVHQVDGNTYCLELWHGPTCAFKDMALQMLPHLLSASLSKTEENRTACILVATSGDTGKAALEGFRDVSHTSILVFYPKDGVSDIQKLQMVTQEGGNVGVCSVMGNFDDAQNGVKELFANRELAEYLSERGYFLSSANSINWGRVLPQVVYYISAYCDLLKDGALQRGDPIHVCVPTGNFGNILAAYYAKKMGVPIGRLICASNANNVLTDFLKTGVYDRRRTFHTTLSPSMDILISSNLERLLFELYEWDTDAVNSCMEQLKQNGLYAVSEKVKKKLGQLFAAGCCDDQRTLRMIGRMWQEYHYLIDPHTAVAFDVLEQYRSATGDQTPALVVSTASPFKFCDSVLSAVASAPSGMSETDMIEVLQAVTGVEPPKPLSALRDKRIRFENVCARENMVEQVLSMLK